MGKKNGVILEKAKQKLTYEGSRKAKNRLGVVALCALGLSLIVINPSVAIL